MARLLMENVFPFRRGECVPCVASENRKFYWSRRRDHWWVGPTLL